MGTVQSSNSRGRSCRLPICGTLTILWTLGPLAAGAEPVVLRGESIRISISTTGSKQRERVEIRDGADWVAALDTQDAVTQVRVAGKDRGCSVDRKSTRLNSSH